jgi:hypothetical protein
MKSSMRVTAATLFLGAILIGGVELAGAGSPVQVQRVLNRMEA